MKKYIAYYRVSTDKQARSGLGLDAQRREVQMYLRQQGGTLVSEYIETLSGRKCDRPEMLKALQECKAKRAILVIAKLDRLSRNSAFVNNLLESRVQFVCCDNPNANPLTLRLLAAIAQNEAEQIGIRTKAALHSIKEQISRRGSYRTQSGRTIKRLGRDGWGSRDLASQAAQKSAQVRSLQSRERLASASARARTLVSEGCSTRAIAQTLNSEGFVTSRGGAFGSRQVSRLLQES